MTATPVWPDASVGQQSANSAAVRNDEQQVSGRAAETIGGPLYATLLERDLKGEFERQAGLDARAVSVITTSGAFVTLSFGLVAVVTKVADYKPSPLIIILLVLAAGSLLAASVLALLARHQRLYFIVKAEQFRTWTEDEFWLDDADQARYLIAHANIKTLESLREGNAIKAGQLVLSLWAQITAFVLLGGTIAVVLIAGS